VNRETRFTSTGAKDLGESGLGLNWRGKQFFDEVREVELTGIKWK
jgi:hypothetical protein